MGIDLTEYEGHALAHWVAPARMHATESHKGWILRSADGDKLAEIMPRNDDNGNPTPEACATRALIAAAPALLAEVVRLRADLAEAVTALDDVTRLIIGECPALLDGDRDGDGRLALRIDAVLSKHGGGQ